MKKGQTYVQKSWDPVGCTYSDGEHQLQQQPRTSVSLFHPPGAEEADLWLTAEYRKLLN